MKEFYSDLYKRRSSESGTDCLDHLTLLALGGGVFHINFVCLFITFLVLGRLPPNLVTFPKIITLEEHGRNLIFVPGFFQGRLFLERVSVENFWSKFFFQDLNCNQITVTINNNRDYWK